MKKLYSIFFFLFTFSLLSAQSGPKCDFHIRSVVDEASCWNSGTVTITAVDGNDNPLYIAPNTATPNPYNNLSTIKYGYRKISVVGDTVHWSNDNVLSLDSGRYMVMAEVLCCDSSIIGEGRYTTLKDSNIVNVVLSYTLLDAYRIPDVVSSSTSRGYAPSLSCINTGREQFAITGGKFPYMIRVHNTDIDELDTIFYTGHQYTGTNNLNYNYKDYYSVDSLAPGHYDFYVEDGCGYKWARISANIGTIEPPTVTGMSFDGWSTVATDSNVIKTTVTVNVPNKYYLKNPEYLQYRFIHKDINGITDTTEWKTFANFGSLNAGNNNVTVYDRVTNAHSYCDIRNKDIVFEAKSTVCDRPYSKTQTITFPLDYLKSVEWYYWSGSYAHYNVLRAAIKIWHVNNNPSTLPEIKYRFIHKDLSGTIDTTSWKYYTGIASKPMGDITIDVLYTDASAHDYCDIYGDTITIEAQLTSCNGSTTLKEVSHIWEKPKMFSTFSRADTVVASYVTEHYNQCGFVPTHPVGKGFPYYFIQFAHNANLSSLANKTTQSLKGPDIDFQVTYPLTWTHTDTSTGLVIKTERLQYQYLNNNHNLVSWNLSNNSSTHWDNTVSVLRHQDVEPIYGWLTDTSYTIPVKRTLTDARGCVLYERIDNLVFEVKNVVDDYPATPQDWTAGYNANGDQGCSTSQRYVYIKAKNYSQQYSDGTVIRLYESPLGNKYNFTATYNLATNSWNVVKDSLSNLANIIPYNYDEIRISDYNLPSGTYKFSVTTQCGPYDKKTTAAFSDTYSWEIASLPSYTRDSTCTSLTLKATEGKYRLYRRNTNDSGPTESSSLINMKFQIITKLPTTDPQNTYSKSPFTTDDLSYATITAPGRYVIEITPYSEGGRCTPPILYDTISFSGGTVSFKYALGYVCNASSTTGYVRAKAADGVPPHTYTLYSGPDKSGTVMAVNNTGIFDNVDIHSGQVVSVGVQDDCMAAFHVNLTTYEMEQLNKAWFPGDAERADVCEGHYISFYAVGLSDDVSYHWTGPDGYTSDTRDNMVFIPRSSTPGWYKVVISNTGCNAVVSEDSVYVDVVPSPWVEVLRDTVICPGQPVTVEFIPHGTGDVNYTVACRENNTVTYTNYNQPTSVTFSPTSSRSYWLADVSDDICSYTIADDTVKVAINDHIATSCDVVTQSEPICHSTDGEVLASSTLAVPYYVKWYRDPEQTQWLRTDTIHNATDYASYAFTGLLQDTSLYVTVSNSEYCESRYGTVSSWKVMTPSNISLRCGESILLFDDGGQDANYAPDQDLFQTFSTSDGQPLTISFEALNIDPSDKLLIYSGAIAHNDSLLAALTGDLTSNLPGPYVSAGNTLTLRFLSDHVTQRAGFQAIISNNPKPASADVHVLDTLSTELVIPHVQVHYDGNATVTANAEGGKGDSYRYSWETSVNGGSTWTSLGDSIGGSSSSLHLSHVTQATHVRVSISDASANPCVGTAQADIFIPVSNVQLTLDLSTPDQQQCESNYPATITVRNHKPGTAHNVTVKLGLPENVAPLNPDDTLIALGDIAGNGSVSVTINLHNSLVPVAATTLPVKAQIWSCSEGDSVPTVLYGDWDWNGAPRQADEDVDSLRIKPVMSLAGYHLIAQDDAVCYTGTAVLRATSDVDMPQYIRWYADPALRTLLKTDTLNTAGESSEYTIENLRQDSTLYITLENDGFCPAIDSAATFAKLNVPASLTMNLTAGSTLVGMADKIKLYDTGGPTGDYGNNENIVHTFSTSSGQVVLRLNYITIGAGDIFFIYDGPTATGAPMYMLVGSSSNINAQVFTSTGGTMTVAMFSDGATVAAGWNADIASSTNYLSTEATASVRTVYPDATLTATDDAVCVFDDATLTAHSNNAIYFTWLASDKKTILLQDTATSHESTLPLSYVLNNATYYVAATPASACPYINLPQEREVLLNFLTDGKTTLVDELDYISFYDFRHAEWAYYHGDQSMTHTFTAKKEQVYASLSSIRLQKGATLSIYDGTNDDPSTLLGVYQSTPPALERDLVSTTGSLTFKFSHPDTARGYGWKCYISNVPSSQINPNSRKTVYLNPTTNGKSTNIPPHETISFYDDGGGSDYSSEMQSLSHTFTALQGQVKLSFGNGSYYGTLNDKDTLYIYDGPAGTGTLIGKYTTTGFLNKTFTSTNMQLGVVFVNRSGSSNKGWYGTLSIVPELVQANVTVKAPATNNHLLTTDTLICYGEDVTLTASSSATNFPQIYTWYRQDYKILFRDTLNSAGASALFRPQQKQDSLYFVTVKQGDACPSRSPVRNIIVRAQPGTGRGYTAVDENEYISFYDDGGSSSYYSYTQGDYVHTFTSTSANPLRMDISSPYLAEGDTLYFYDGPNVDPHQLLSRKTSYSENQTTPTNIVSTTITVKFAKHSSKSDRGWSISISRGSSYYTQASYIVWDTAYVRLKAPINAGHITATHDTVCYDNTATLYASSDIGFPQYYSWYNSDGTTLLYRDTAQNAGDISTFRPNHQKTDTHYYVAIHDQNNCPYVPNTKLTKKTIRDNFLLGPSNTGGTTNITKFDSIPFYDEGGPNNDPTHSGTWIHTFTTDTGHVILRLDKLSFSCGYGVSSSGVYNYYCYLIVYDGNSTACTKLGAGNNNQGAVQPFTRNPLYDEPKYIESSGNSLTVQVTFDYSYNAVWEGAIYSSITPDSVLAKSNVRIKAPLTADHITATHDTVCYDNTATLHASSNIGYPQYYSWYKDDGKTLLHRDTAFSSGDHSTFQPEHQVVNSLYYVAINNDTSCPYLPDVHNLLIKKLKNNFFFDSTKDGGITYVQLNDSIPFYDEGGPNSNYSTHKITWTHTFTSPTGNVILKLDQFHTQHDYLMVYDSSTASGRTLGGNSEGKIIGSLSSSCPIILRSSGNSLTVQWTTDANTTYSGWRGFVYSTDNDAIVAPSTVHIKAPLTANYITATHDTVCYDNTATLHASSDIAFPQYYSWYKDDGKTMLHRDTAFNTGDVSTFQPEHQIRDSLYYVVIHNDTTCPYLSSVHDIYVRKDIPKIVRTNFLFNSEKNGGSTNVKANDLIPFYDEGGPSGNYSTKKASWTHTFTSQAGNIVLKLDDFYSESTTFDYLIVYDGSTASGRTLGGNSQGRIGGNLSSSCPIILTSSENSLTVQWVTDASGNYSGWKGSVYSTNNDTIVAPSTVHIKEPLKANYITATHDTVCYDNTATLHASSNIAFPQYYSWYKDDGKTLLHQDTAFTAGDLTILQPEHQVKDSLYYVTIYNDTTCPYLTSIHDIYLRREIPKIVRTNFLFNSEKNGGFTNVKANDSIPFYDEGGPSSNYSTNNITWTHTFTSLTGNVVLKLSSFYSQSSLADYLMVYDGSTASGSTLGGNSQGRIGGFISSSSLPIILTSSGNSLTVQWTTNDTINRTGWSGFVYSTYNDTLLATSSVKVCPVNADTVYQATCQSSTPYNYDNFHNVDVSSVGTIVIDSLYQNQYGCDSTVTLILTVNPTLVLSATSSSHCRNLSDGYIDLTVGAGSPPFEIQWSGKVSGSHSLTAPGSYRIENLPDSIYDITVTDAKNCSATLKDTISQIDDTLTITANSHTFDYDGTPHTDNGFTVDFGAFSSASTSGTVTLPNGDIVNATITGSITEVSESPKPNVVTAYSVNRGADDVTCEYAVKTIDGTLTINAVSAPLLIKSPSCEWDYNGKYDSCTAYTITFNGADVPECTACTPPAGSKQYVLPTNDTITISDPIRVRDVTDTSNTFTLHIQNGATYTNVDTVYGSIRINPIGLTISTDSSEKIFDGLPLTAHSWLNNPPVGLATGDTVVWVDIYGSITDMGDSLNRAHPIAVIVNTSTGDTVTGNYNISYNFGTLSVYGVLSVLAAAAPDSIQSVSCNGSDDGSGTFVLVGGKPGAHTYSLDGGTDVTITSDTIKITHLMSGNHTLVVTDLMGNTDTLTFTVGSPEPLVAHISVPTDIADRCPNQGIYNVTATITGGTTPYNIVWGKDANNVNNTTTTVTQTLANDCGKEYEVTILVTDTNHCSAKDTARFTVLDTIKPTFDVPADTTLYLNSSCSANTDSTVTGKPTSLADNCTPAANLKVTHSDAETPGCGSSKTIVRTWTVTDACGNATSKKQTISVLDTIRPTFDVPGDTTLYLNSSCSANTDSTVTGKPTSLVDNCTPAANLKVTHSDAETPGCGSSKTIVRTWTVTDACGNATSKKQTISVLDTIKPTFDVPGDTTLCRSAGGVFDASITITGKPTALNDNCTPVTNLIVSYTDVDTSGTNPGKRVISREWTVKDACGNTTKKTQLITIKSYLDPAYATFDCPADTQVTLAYGACDTLLGIGNPTFTLDPLLADLEYTITHDAPVDSIYSVASHLVTWTVTDVCGFSTNCSQTVDVVFPPCGTPLDSVSDWDGFKYSSVRIGCQCWTGENLRSTHYSDGTLIPVAKKYMESNSMEAIYGRLYNWYSTVRVEEGNDNVLPTTTSAPHTSAYVQGVCPDGWAVPTTEEYRQMFYDSGNSADRVKSPSTLVWLPGMEGSGPSLFDAFGGGYYDGAISKYLDLRAAAHFWTSTTVLHSCFADEFGIILYCGDAIYTESHKSLGYSVRCIRKK